MTYFAHSNGQDKNEWQTLKDHLFNTRELAETICAGTTFAEFAGVAALLHDIGKYSMAFQRKLDGAKIQVDHSTAGAKEVRRLFNNTPVEGIQAMLLAYCIAGHHGLL
ncbi:MAG: CRISPR-associated endonuclease Cas3'' [Anaerolineae bacterium]|jgi:CRISPR-associated endonuclease Cas3-HD|nr:CRISPR-associated endonuclease Cas3'' [Anaerolineae bacterium]